MFNGIGWGGATHGLGMAGGNMWHPQQKPGGSVWDQGLRNPQMQPPIHQMPGAGDQVLPYQQPQMAGPPPNAGWGMPQQNTGNMPQGTPMQFNAQGQANGLPPPMPSMQMMGPPSNAGFQYQAPQGGAQLYQGPGQPQRSAPGRMALSRALG